jgi:hypothetical protein
MSISQNFPTIRPTLNLNFARSKTLDPRITFTRSSTATYVDEDGLIKTAAADEARFDHDPTTGESKGLLIEGSGNNYFDQSQTMSNWSVSNASFETNTAETLAPDGTNTAHKLTATGSGEIQHNIIKFTGINNYNNTYFSVWLKTASGNGHFQMNTGNIVYPANATTGYLAVYGAYVIPYPNGWYRFVVARNYSSTSGGVTLGIHLNANSGNGGYGVISAQSFEQSGEALYIWGPQWETNSNVLDMTSYIPTSGSTATRSRDKVSIEGDNFTSWYNQSEGTWICNFDYMQNNNSGTSSLYSTALDQDDRNWLRVNYSAGTPDTIRQAINSSANDSTTTVPHDEDNKIAQSYENLSQTVSINGGVDIETTGTISTNHTKLQIGNIVWSDIDSTILFGRINKLIYYPERLTDSQLQNLTK